MEINPPLVLSAGTYWVSIVPIIPSPQSAQDPLYWFYLRNTSTVPVNGNPFCVRDTTGHLYGQDFANLWLSASLNPVLDGIEDLMFLLAGTNGISSETDSHLFVESATTSNETNESSTSSSESSDTSPTTSPPPSSSTTLLSTTEFTGLTDSDGPDTHTTSQAESTSQSSSETSNQNSTITSSTSGKQL